MSDALKSNTTLAELNLGCEHRRNNTQMAPINNPLFSTFMKSTGNNIQGTGATSLSDALKSNTTLTTLDLRSEHKRYIRMKSVNNPLFFFSLSLSLFSSNKPENDIGAIGATSLSEALISNTTLTKLDLWCKLKKMDDTQKAFTNYAIFSVLIKSTDNNIGVIGATSLSEALESNTVLNELSLSGEHNKKQHTNNANLQFILSPFSLNR